MKRRKRERKKERRSLFLRKIFFFLSLFGHSVETLTSVFIA